MAYPRTGRAAVLCHDHSVSEHWRQQHVRLGWGRMSVQVAGAGPPVLLLHGLGGSGRYWAGLAPLLASERTLIAPDLAGFGRSDKPTAVDYSRAFHLDSLEGILEGLGFSGPITVVGHSMGGILAALFAARRAADVDALALAATPFPRVQLHPYRVPGSGLARAVYGTVQRILPLVSPLVRSRTFPRAVVADYLRHTVDSYERTSHALIWDPTAADELAALRALDDTVPELLLFSDEDHTIAPDSLERWRAVLPKSEVVLIPGAHQLLLRGGFATLAGWVRGRAAGQRVA